MNAARRFRRTPLGYRGSLALVLLVALVAWRLYRGAPVTAPNSPDEPPRAVARVVDGDTLLLADRTRVRLIGVDTPETVKEDSPVEPWGPEASAFTKAFVGQRPVQLGFDGDRTDQHGRLLAYVYVDERLLNEELLRAGLARHTPHYRYSQAMKSRFHAAEQEARQAHRGIWSSPQRSGR